MPSCEAVIRYLWQEQSAALRGVEGDPTTKRLDQIAPDKWVGKGRERALWFALLNNRSRRELRASFSLHTAAESEMRRFGTKGKGLISEILILPKPEFFGRKKN